jgi:hypothetical protein
MIACYRRVHKQPVRGGGGGARQSATLRAVLAAALLCSPQLSLNVHTIGKQCESNGPLIN